MSLEFRQEECDCLEDCEGFCGDSPSVIFMPVEYMMLNCPRLGKEFEDVLYLHMRARTDGMSEGQKKMMTGESTTINSNLLYPTQHTVKLDKVQEYAQRYEHEDLVEDIVVAGFKESRYTYLLDGHHRAVAYMLVHGREPLPCMFYKFDRKMVL